MCILGLMVLHVLAIFGIAIDGFARPKVKQIKTHALTVPPPGCLERIEKSRLVYCDDAELPLLLSL
jgi:hypothetical protein